MYVTKYNHLKLILSYHVVFRLVQYQNVLASCKIHRLTTSAPSWVVFSDSKCGQPNAIMPVMDNRAAKPEANFTICLHKAFVHGYDNVTQFVEWVEVGRILGADKIAVYNYSGNEVLLPYVKHYQDLGLLDYYQWPAQDFVHLIPPYVGQGAVIDDCIYRYMYRTKYLILIDVDEVVVPQHPYETWAELMEAQENPCRDAPYTMVRNSFFVHQQPHDTSYTQIPRASRLKLDTLALTRRNNFTFPCPIRSKIVMRPVEVISASVHNVTRLVHGKPEQRKCCMPPHVALLHHYRFWSIKVKKQWLIELKRNPQNYKPCWDNQIKDNRMAHYSQRIIAQVTKTHTSVNSNFFS